MGFLLRTNWTFGPKKTLISFVLITSSVRLISRVTNYEIIFKSFPSAWINDENWRIDSPNETMRRNSRIYGLVPFSLLIPYFFLQPLSIGSFCHNLYIPIPVRVLFVQIRHTIGNNFFRKQVVFFTQLQNCNVDEKWAGLQVCVIFICLNDSA